MRLSITGAAGFLGQAVVRAALARGHTPVAVVRNASAFPDGVEVRAVGDLQDAGAQDAAVEGCNAVIHLAAWVRMRRQETSERVRRLNVETTEALARAAAKAGVRRFVFASSFAVFGASHPHGQTLTDDTPPAPVTAYGLSKRQAELRLDAVAEETGLSVISLRPPAIYGPGATGQFPQLIKAVRMRLPLPLMGVRNLRSVVYSENLAEAFVVAAESTATGAFIVVDSPPLSSAELVEQFAESLGVKARLLPVPATLTRTVAKLVGKGNLADSLLGSMAADGARFCRATGWRPRISLEDAIALTVRDLRASAGVSRR